MNFNFGDILTRAWNITWKHRALWLFGILASCGTGGSGFSSSSNFGSGGQNSGTGEPPQFIRDMAQVFNNPDNLVKIVIIIFVILLVLSFIITAVSTIGRIGLIRGTMQAQKNETPVMGELFSGGWAYFWRSFWMWALIGFPFAFIYLAIGIGFLAGMLAFFAAVGPDEQATRLVSFVPVLFACACFTALFGIVLGWVGQQAQTALVLENLGIVDSVKRGWGIVRKNIVSIILMSVVLGLIHWFASLLIGIPLIIILVPALVAFIVSASRASSELSFTPFIIAGFAMLCYLPISLTANGILTAFTQSAWTLTYVELTGQPETPVIETNVQV